MTAQSRQAAGLSFPLVAILVFTLLLQGCNVSGERSAPTGAPPLVTVIEVQPRDVPIFADFSAQTYARNMVDVRSRVAGYVDKWLFRPGA